MLRALMRPLGRVATRAAATPMWTAPTKLAAPATWASYATKAASTDLDHMRNIGISAHIDSGKTTLTERILYYTGRIKDIHEVRGKDGVGAKMDSMELEREKGITIQSAATYTQWGDHQVNIIDTPGHVDFTIEVERALRVLDGAVLVLCGVSGVQSQSITVDRQMRRYKVPRIAFVNKLDRMGANPHKVVEQMRSKLRHHAALVQLPIGLEDRMEGVVDLVGMQALYNDGDQGETIRVAPIPDDMVAQAAEHRAALIEAVADVDDGLAEIFLMDEEPSTDELRAAIRRAVVGNHFIPVFCGSAYKNRGVQPLLDGVVDYLPNPTEVVNEAIDNAHEDEPKVALPCDASKPFVGLAFKLEEGRYGQLTYVRVYQGKLKRGENIVNVNSNKRVKVPRLVRMHSDEMEDIQEATAGDIVALFGVECSSGDTFTTNDLKYTMTSMHVPDPVISLAIKPSDKSKLTNFGKALQRFQREDPTFRVHTDENSGETIISGMGELHLDIYVQRMEREYKVATEVGKPRVNFRESISRTAEFNYLHKKQSGGAGQFGRVVGYLEPIEITEEDLTPLDFRNDVVGGTIPPQYIPAVEKGFYEAVEKGGEVGYPVVGVRMIVNDGQSHPVDSSELAFKIASEKAFRQGMAAAGPVVLEPVMNVAVEVPPEHQSNAIGLLNKRKGIIVNSEQDDYMVAIQATVPLNNMFGFSTDLRSATQGKGEFSMVYSKHVQAPRDVQEKLRTEYEEQRAAGGKK